LLRQRAEGNELADKVENPKTDQKRRSQGTARDGAVNQHRPTGGKSVGSHKPGGDGAGKKKWHHEHDDRETRK
jgi:hypothetical protein